MLAVVFPVTSKLAPVSATIDGDAYKLSLETSNSIALTLNPSTAGALSVAKHTVTGSTSSPSGYKLYISTASNTNDIRLNDDNIIRATTGTYSSPAVLSLTDSQNAVWGYAIPGLNNFDAAVSYNESNPSATAKFAAVPTANNEQLIHTHATAAADDTTDIYYGVKANLGLSAGNYQGVIRYLSVTDISSVSAGEATIMPNELTPGYAATTATITTSLKTDLNLGSNPLNVSIIGQGTSTTTTCSNPTITTQSPLTFTCTVPAGLAVGTYNIEVTVNKLSKTYTIDAGLNVKQPYTWEKYSANTTTIYDWDIYNVTTNYNWEKWNAAKKYKESKSSSTSSWSVSRTNARSYYYGTSYTFDAATGKYTVNQTTKPSSTATCSTIGSAKYYFISTSTSSGSQTGTTMYQLNSGSGSSTCSLPRYTYTAADDGYIKGTTQSGTVTSTNASAYPDNGTPDNTYWYVKAANTYTKGSTKTGAVSDASSTAYPANGANSDNTAWYVSTGSHQVYSKGSTSQGTVTGTTINDYPCYGYQNGYWYVRTAPTVCLVLEYNANGGSGAPDTGVYDPGTTATSSHTFTISTAKIPTKSGYDFKGYATSSSATTPAYTYNGSTFSPSAITVSSSNNPATLYAVWEKQKFTFDQAFANAGKSKQNNYYKMQDMTASICSAVSTPETTTEDISTQLIDTRDNKIYWVSKLKDGHCWMLDNLALDLTNQTVLNGLDATNTNIDTTNDPDALAALKGTKLGTTSDKYATAKVANWTSSYSYSAPLINTASKDSVYGAPADGKGFNKVGVYYNYCAASAGSYCYGNGTSYGTPSGNATSSICPKGWRMPTGGSGGEYQALYTAYSSNYTNFRNALSLPLSGYFDNGSAYSQGSNGNFWSSTRNNDYKMHSLSALTSKISPTNGLDRLYGYSVRCVAGS